MGIDTNIRDQEIQFGDADIIRKLIRMKSICH